MADDVMVTAREGAADIHFYETDKPHGLKHNPFKSLVAPRPIGWITSLNEAGIVNLAPFSFFQAVADAPPMVIIAVNGTHKDKGAKDTLANIRATQEFVCSIATWETREAMNTTSAHVDRGVDEMKLAGLAPAPSRLVKPPRVAAAPAALECVLHQIVELPSSRKDSHNTTIFGRVVGVHIDRKILTDGKVDMEKFQPIARLGYLDYAVVRADAVFTMRRPD